MVDATAALLNPVRFHAMNSLAYACAALVGTAAAASASPAERAIIAAMKLSEQPNYSWFSMFDESSGSFEIEGKTTPAGVTWLRMPMPQSLGRQLGREADTRLEALFDAQRVGIVRVGNNWHFPAEVGAPRERDANPRPGPLVRGSASGRFGIAGGQSVGAAPFLADRRGSRTFSAREFGVTHPHEELAIIVSSHAQLEVAGDIVSGTLTDIGAALLLVREGQSDVEPLVATGSFRLWLKDGTVIKYQLKLEGELLVSRWKKVNVKLSATTHLKEIGTTRVDVPIEAREKLAMGR
jgi:hypothetical protein